jgi:magnesium transporter
VNQREGRRVLKRIDRQGQAVDQGGGEAVWTDLCSPTDAEIGEVETRYGLTIPSRDSLSEIEQSSRLRVDRQGRLMMSAPLIAQSKGVADLSPTGFILVNDSLVTIRFADTAVFDEVHADLSKQHDPLTGKDVLVRLLEEVVDRAADRLERIAEDLAAASQAIFREPAEDAPRHRVGRETRRLRALIVRIGRSSEQMVRVRHTFLAVGRIAHFVIDRCDPKISAALKDRLVSVKQDIDSLDEFETSLTGRVQLLLDAATGFISIEQNDVVKVLTVVSVAGVPPVLIAGIYGMNFKYMPELSWTYGYPLAMVVMAASTVLPVLWFKWRDWL